MLYKKTVRRPFIMKKRKLEKRGGGITGIFIGALIITVTYLLIGLLTSAVLYNGDDPTANIALYSIAAFTVSGAIGALISAVLFGKESILSPILSCATVAFVFLVLAEVINGSIGINHILSVICFMAAAILALAIFKKRKPDRSARKRRHRSVKA